MSTFPKPRFIVYTIKAFLPLYCYLALWTIHITLSPFQQVAVVYWKESRQAVERNLVDIPTTSGKFCPSVQFSSVQSLSHVRLFATPWTAALQASLSITNSWSLLKLMSIESVMSFNYLILCRPLLLSPSIFPSIRVFSNESAFHIRWPKYWSFRFNISPSHEHSGLISFRMEMGPLGSPSFSQTVQ